MIPKPFRLAFYVIICISLVISKAIGQNTQEDKHVEVVLRMIAHQILLTAKDTTSRVLPITKTDQRFRIPFETEFSFEPSVLVATIDSIVKQSNLANTYMVEVEDCKTKEVVYSFKMAEDYKEEIIPCAGRIQPKGCYELFFTIIDINKKVIKDGSEASNKVLKFVGIGLLVLLLITLIYLVYKKQHKKSTNPDLISLGQYQFDKRNTELILENQHIELTSKEADLLLLLYNAANTTVEREIILSKIWKDEGHYVGRTLDVFISKLRKKLEFDSKVKIVNIRGIGYKLVMND